MIKTLAKFVLNKVIRWKFIGSFPEDEKYIIAVIPHSSYFDLIIAVLIRTYSGIKIKFIGYMNEGLSKRTQERMQ